MSIFSYFNRSILADLLDNRSKAAKARGRFRPRVETLEDRLAPAVFMVALAGNDADPIGAGGGSYRTIQAAVNAAAAANDGNDIVNVATGTYNTAGVDARFDIPASANLQNLQLLGGWDAAFTVRNAAVTPTDYTFTNSPAANRYDIQVFDPNTTIDGFTFRSYDGITARDADTILVQTTGVTVSNNILNVGIRPGSGARPVGVVTGGADNSGLQILNNTFNVNFAGTPVNGTAAIGVFLNPSVPTTGVVIDGNTFSGNNMNSGIIVSGVNGVTIQNNTITRDTPLFGAGIELRDNIASVDGTNILDNTILDINTAAANSAGGIVLGGSGGLNAPVTNSVIRGNIISMAGSNSQGVFARTGTVAASTLIERNAITAPTAGLAALSQVAGLDVSGNWFGSAAAVAVDSAISAFGGGTIVARSYLSSGTDANPAAPGLQLPAATEMLVPQTAVTSGLTEVDGRIQSGIDHAAVGMTVRVAADTYVEQVTVTKALTLLGANAGIAGNGVRGAETIVLTDVSDPDPFVAPYPVLVYVAASNVTIDGFKLDGDNPGLTSGVIFNGADVDAEEGIASYDGVGNITVLNNIIQNTSYSGIDFYNFYNGGAATSTNVISNNLIQSIGADVYGYGIGVLLYNNFYADVTNNVIANARTGVQTGNFYQANPGATGSISNNDIAARRTGIFYNLHYSSASPFTIEGNNISAVTNDAVGNTRWFGIALSSQGTGVDVNVLDNIIDGSGSNMVETAGYSVWNTQATAESISGGTVTGVDYGVWVNNYEGYVSNANNTQITVDGVSITADLIGVYVLDSPSNTNGATVQATITNSTVITTGGLGTGVLVRGSDASARIIGNGITGNTSGIKVDAGTALVQGNNLNNNSYAGLLIQNGGMVDAGQVGIGSNFTGLGISTGSNDFRSYKAGPGAKAIRNLNTGGLYLLAGPNGLPYDVMAQNNVFHNASLAFIEQVVEHDADNAALGFVNFAPPSKKGGPSTPPAPAKGNNGIGNGLDPQPPGNPPENDTSGLGNHRGKGVIKLV